MNLSAIFSAIKSEKLLRGSSILFVTTMVANLCNYLFQFLMSRELSTGDYGAMNSLFSLMMVLSVPTISILMVVSKHISKFTAHHEDGKAKGIFIVLLKRVSQVAALLFIAIALLSPSISSYLKMITITPVIIVGLIISLSFILYVPLGALQGRQSFFYLGIGLALLGVMRLLFGVVFSSLSITLNGALGAVLGSLVVVLLVSVISLRKFFTLKREPAGGETRRAFFYSFPVVVSLTSFMVLIYSDMFLVKHYFPADIAGRFAALAVVGKIIVYLPAAIVLALFPLVSESTALHQKRQSYQMLTRALSYNLLLAGLCLIIFVLFPKLTLTLLFGAKFAPLYPLLRLYGVAMFLYSILNVLMNFNLACNYTNFVYSFIISAVLQIYLISTFHESLQYVVSILIGNAGLLLAFNLLMTFWKRKKLAYEKQSI